MRCLFKYAYDNIIDFNNNRNFNTIYQDFMNTRNKKIFKSIDDEIAFISARLIYSGLEDVMSIDKKWREYANIKNGCGYTINNNKQYLEFIIYIIKEYHKKNDQFDKNLTFDDI